MNIKEQEAILGLDLLVQIRQLNDVRDNATMTPQEWRPNYLPPYKIDRGTTTPREWDPKFQAMVGINLLRYCEIPQKPISTPTKRPAPDYPQTRSSFKRPRTMPAQPVPKSVHIYQEHEKEIAQGKWSPDEHALFLEGMRYFGKEWKRVATLIRTRNSIQVRSHAQKYFQKLNRKVDKSNSQNNLLNQSI